MTGIAVVWLDIAARWIHVIAAIMWIGDSLLFMWIDSHLRPDPESRADVAGVTWLLHAGGYYHLEQRRLLPGRLPPYLRWFWLEATTTWISGFLLLILVYYLNADALMIDRGVSHLTAAQSIAVGLAMLPAGWFLYDALWRTPLARAPLPAWSVSFALLAGTVYAVTHLLSPRAAFLHVGAVLGTIMVVNVWVHVLPPQRRMLQAARSGRDVDYSLGRHAKIRSTHNTYLTFPVIFLMLSQHFPSVLAARPLWVVLVLFVVLGAGARHVMLAGIPAARWSGVAAAAAAVVLGLLIVARIPPSPRGPSGTLGEAASAPSFAAVRGIIAQRCAACHSETPVMPGIAAAPNGVKFDTPAEIEARAALIKLRAVDLGSMPPGNVTHITDAERDILKRWVEAGAPLK
ncbi:MAG TPA: urate hydroxylase PuuD [bacterium]|nr:urate hydroxylase PuuD [bacterium]